MPVRPIRKSDKRTEDYVYSLPTEHSDAEEQMVTDDGPPPMKNFKPAEKRQTGADQFWREHEAEYEARAKPPELCQQVNMHNTACPKLKDELLKKESVAKPTAVSEKQAKQTRGQSAKNRYYDPNCPKCVKERISREKREKLEKEKVKRQRNRENKNKSRVTKPRRQSKHKRRLQRKHKYTRNRGCQYLPPEFALRKPLSNLSCHDDQTVKVTEIQDGDTGIQPVIATNSRASLAKSGSLNLSNKYPDTSNPSITSYHSFVSTDHEPMVLP